MQFTLLSATEIERDWFSLEAETEVPILTVEVDLKNFYSFFLLEDA